MGPADNSIKGIQQVDAKDYRLTVDGLVDSPAQYTYDEVRGLPSVQRLITIHCVEGWDATILWKGVAMKTLLDAAAAKPEAVTVIFHAVDGYTTSLPLAEILQKDLMLAYDGNGIALPDRERRPIQDGALRALVDREGAVLRRPDGRTAGRDFAARRQLLRRTQRRRAQKKKKGRSERAAGRRQPAPVAGDNPRRQCRHRTRHLLRHPDAVAPEPSPPTHER